MDGELTVKLMQILLFLLLFTGGLYALTKILKKRVVKGGGLLEVIHYHKFILSWQSVLRDRNNAGKLAFSLLSLSPC